MIALRHMHGLSLLVSAAVLGVVSTQTRLFTASIANNTQMSVMLTHPYQLNLQGVASL